MWKAGMAWQKAIPAFATLFGGHEGTLPDCGRRSAVMSEKQAAGGSLFSRRSGEGGDHMKGAKRSKISVYTLYAARAAALSGMNG